MNIKSNVQTKKRTYKKKCGNCGKIVQYKKDEYPLRCPYEDCLSKWWDKPPTEVKLFILQDNYLKDRNQQTLSEMYTILKSYSKSTILKMLKGKYKYDSDYLSEKSHDVAVQLITLYLKKPQFKIDNSFNGYLRRKVQQELFGSKKEEKHDSLNQLIKTKGDDKELIEALGVIGYSSLMSQNPSEEIFSSDYYVYEILKIINRYIPIIKRKSTAISLLTLIGLKNYIQNHGDTSKFMLQYYNVFGLKVQKAIKEIARIIYRSLMGVEK